MTKKDKEFFAVVVGAGEVQKYPGPTYVTLIAEGKIEPFQYVVPGDKQGTVRALRKDEPLYVRGKKNHRIIGRVRTWGYTEEAGFMVDVKLDNDDE